MFRDKKFLVEQGLSKNTWNSTSFILGHIYDLVKENGCVYDNEISRVFQEKRQYVKDHPEIFPKTFDKAITEETIVMRLWDVFGDVKVTADSMKEFMKDIVTFD